MAVRDWVLACSTMAALPDPRAEDFFHAPLRRSRGPDQPPMIEPSFPAPRPACVLPR